MGNTATDAGTMVAERSSNAPKEKRNTRKAAKDVLGDSIQKSIQTKSETPKNVPEAAPKEAVWTASTGWAAPLVAGAKEYIGYEGTANRDKWRAARVAVRLRSEFGARAVDKEHSWEVFCSDVLKRDQNTVAADARAVEFCDAVKPVKLDIDAILKNSSAYLPALYQVARLNSLPKNGERDAIQKKLFAGEFETSRAFEDAVSALKGKPKKNVQAFGEATGPEMALQEFTKAVRELKGATPDSQIGWKVWIKRSKPVKAKKAKK